jgi:hypothetical protein
MWQWSGLDGGSLGLDPGQTAGQLGLRRES